MVSIPSAVVEDALARLYRVASDKRVAFRSRIKHFQRLRFPDGTNTGKGKPAAFSFSQYMQLLLAFELVQSGLSPTTAAMVVGEWWINFYKAFARTMVDDDNVLSDPEEFTCRDLMFMIYFDAMWQLANEGEVSDRSQYWGMVKIVAPDQIGDTISSEEFVHKVDSPWRALVIDARWLLETAVARIREAGFDLSNKQAFDDLLRDDASEILYQLELRDNGHP